MCGNIEKGAAFTFETAPYRRSAGRFFRRATGGSPLRTYRFTRHVKKGYTHKEGNVSNPSDLNVNNGRWDG